MITLITLTEFKIYYKFDLHLRLIYPEGLRFLELSIIDELRPISQEELHSHVQCSKEVQRPSSPICPPIQLVPTYHHP